MVTGESDMADFLLVKLFAAVAEYLSAILYFQFLT